MPIRSLLRHILSVLMVVSFIAAPFAIPASASEMAPMAAMSDEMECCPTDVAPKLSECDQGTCPQAIVCVVQCLPNVISAITVPPLRGMLREAFLLQNDDKLKSLSLLPLPEPPRA